MSRASWHPLAVPGPGPVPALALALALALGLSLAGCGLSGPGLEEMEAKVLHRLEQPAEAGTAPAPVTGPFDAALKAAVLADPGYRAALAAEAEALAAIGGAEAALRPQVSGSATAGAIRETDPADTTAGLAGEMSLSQLLYDGGAARGAIGGARARALAAVAAREERANAAALDAARAWVELWQHDARLALLGERTGALDALVAQIERMSETGMLDKSAYDAARRKIVDVELARAELEGQRDAVQSRFRRQFGALPATLDRPRDFVGPAGLRAFTGAWPTAPALRRAAAELLLAEAAVAEAEAAFRPKVALQAGLASPMDEDETSDVTAGLRLSYTFGDGGRRQAALAAARERARAREAGLEEARDRAKEAMRIAIDRLAAIDRAMPLIARKIALSTSEAEVARSQLVTGQSNLRQLVDAEIERYRAEDQRLQMQAERLLLHLSIMSGAGELAPAVGIGG